MPRRLSPHFKGLLIVTLLIPVAVDFGFTYWIQTIRPYLGEISRSVGFSTAQPFHVAAWKKYRTSHRIYHHDLSVNYTGTPEPWGPHMPRLYTNSLGFKDESRRKVALVANHPRVLFLGDSFTEGLGYEWEQTFVGRIQSEWKAKNIEVLNAGVTSYSPIIHYRKTKYLLETVGLKFDHAVVFIDITDILDETTYELSGEEEQVKIAVSKEYVRSKMQRPNTPTEAIFLNHTTLIRSGLIALRKQFSSEEKYGLGLIRSTWMTNQASWNQWGERGLRKAVQRMSQLASLLRARGISLSIAIYPWPDQVYARALNCLQVTTWKAWAQREGAAFVNLFPSFITEEPWYTTLDKYYVPGNDHWNERGYALVAQEFLRQTAAQGMDFSRRAPITEPRNRHL